MSFPESTRVHGLYNCQACDLNVLSRTLGIVILGNISSFHCRSLSLAMYFPLTSVYFLKNNRLCKSNQEQMNIPVPPE